MSTRTEHAKKSSLLERKSPSPTQAVRRHGDSYMDVQRERDTEEAVGTPAHGAQDRGPEEPSEEPVGTDERLEGEDA
jgi:hypothetical protein